MKPILARAILVVFALALAAACAELALRVAGPPWLAARMQELRAGHAVLGEDSVFNYLEDDGRHFTAFRPRVSFVLMDREFRTDVHVTEWGTRATGADAAGPDTIVFLGDSFAFGFGVEDDETFVSRACRARGLACLDAAFPGSALSSQLDVVERRYAIWGRPRRLVFVFFAGNDLPELVASAAAPAAAAAPARAPGGVVAAINARVNTWPPLRQSYVVQLAKAAVRARLQPGAMDPMFITASGAGGPFGREAAAALDAALVRLDALSGRLGFAPSFVLIPDRFQLYPAARDARARYYGLDAAGLDMLFPQRLVRERLGRRAIPVLDVLPCLDPADESLYFKSDNHLTARGHDAVARCLLKATFPL